MKEMIKLFYDFLLELKEKIRIMDYNIHGFNESISKLKA